MKNRTKVLWTFLGTIAILVGALLVFIQSKTFASILKDVASRYMPIDFSVDGSFSELSVKLVPPGVVIKNPAIVLKEKNPVGLPAGTKLDAQSIDVTFQFFQLLSGTVTINAFIIHGATLKLDLDEKFFAAQEKARPSKSIGLGSKFSWDNLVRFSFRSVSLLDSQVDLRFSPGEGRHPMRVQAYAKELTIGRGTVEGLPSYDLAVDLQKAYMEIGGFQHAMSQLQASVEVSSGGVAIRNLSLQEGELNVHTNGQIRGNVLKPKALKADLDYIVRGPVERWFDPSLAGRFVKLPRNTQVAGLLTIEGRLTGDLLDLPRTVDVKAGLQLENARFSDWKVEKAELKARLKGTKLLLDSAELRMGDGTVRLAKLEYDLKAPRQTLNVRAELENTDFRRMLGPEIRSVYPLHMFFTGSAEAEVTIDDGVEVDGGLDLVVRKFSFDNQKYGVTRPMQVLLAIPEIKLKSRFAIDEDGFRFSEAQADLPHSKLRAAGSVGPSGVFDIDVRGPVSLADIGKLSAFDIRGDGELHWTVKGKKPEVVFGFEAELDGGRYLNLDLGKVKGKIVYNDGNDTLYFHELISELGRSRFIANGTINVGKTDEAAMTIQVPRGTIQDFATVFDSFIVKAVPWYPRSLAGQMTGVIKVSGKTQLDQLSVEGDLELNNVDYLRESLRYAKMHAGYRRGAYVAENVYIRKKSGTFKGNFIYGADDALKFDLKSEGLSTLDSDLLASFGIPYRAPIEIETRGAGKIGSLKSFFNMRLGEGVIKTYSVPRSEISVETEAGKVRGQVAVFGGEIKGRLDMGWQPGSASSFDIEARSFDFQPMLIALNTELADDPELRTELTGAAHLKFQTGDLSHLSGTVALSSYDLRRRGYSLSLAKPVSVEIQNGNYRFSDVRFTGDGTAIVMAGHAHDGAIDASLKGSLDLGFFEFLVAELASVRGSAQVDAILSGRAAAPSFKASVAASGLDVRLHAIEQPFEDARFNLDWQDTLMRVNNFNAKFAGGQVRGDGTIALYSYKSPDMDLRMELDNTKVKVFPVAYARTSGKLALKGSELPYKVKGSLNVVEALIKENFNAAENARVLRSSKFLPQKSASAAGEMQVFDLDVDIAADRGVYVKNDLFDAEVKGSIKVINSIRTPRVLGQASVLHGRLLFKDNFFAIQSGSLYFRNPAAIDPEFELSGQTELKGYKVLLVASGQASSPNIDFRSQPALSQNDIVNLLALGVTSADFQSISRENRDAYSRDEMYNLLFSQSGVNKGLQQKLGVKVRVDQSQMITPESAFRARSTNDAAETVAPKVVLQKEVTKNLNASLGSTVGIGVNQERNVNLEYGFSRHWSVLGTYEDQRGSQPSQSRTSLGADLKYKIRFK